MPTTQLARAASRSVVYNIIVQFLSRSMTFILGAITLKYYKSTSILGIVNVRLALLYTTLQFISREPFRRACLGEAANSTRPWNKIVNVIWLGFPLSLTLALILGHYWQSYMIPSANDLIGTSVLDYKIAVLIICLSAILEMVSEPCYIYSQTMAYVGLNPSVEALSIFIKCSLTAFVTFVDPPMILTCIATCHFVASAAAVGASFWFLVYKRQTNIAMLMPQFSIKPHQLSRINDTSKLAKFNRQKSVDRNRPNKNKGQLGEEEKGFSALFDMSSFWLSCSFMGQTVLKQILTEGERYIMTIFDLISLPDQGIYDVVSNLGGLVVRLIFRPIEDSGFAYFSQLVKRNEILDKAQFEKVEKNLITLIKVMIIVGLVVFVFGFNYSPFIAFYAGDKLNNSVAFNLMRWHLFSMPFLALNGVTECFTFAIMNQSEIKNHSYLLVIFTLIFLMSVFLTQWILGSACFIFANCLNMSSRILFSYRQIRSYFQRHQTNFKLQDLLPQRETISCCFIIFLILSVSQYYLLHLQRIDLIMLHILVGFVSMLALLYVLFQYEVTLVKFAKHMYKSKMN